MYLKEYLVLIFFIVTTYIPLNPCLCHILNEELKVTPEVMEGSTPPTEENLPIYLNSKGEKRNDYVFSNYKLTKLAEMERRIYNRLLHYLNESDEQYKTAQIERYIKDYKDTIQMSAPLLSVEEKWMNPIVISSHPTRVFQMIRRLTKDFTYIQAAMYSKGSEIDKKFLQDVKHIEDDMNLKLPTIEDSRDALEAIIRIQFFYDYSAKNFAKGIFGSTETNVEVTIEQAVEIGFFAKSLGATAIRIEWLEVAQKKCLKQTDTSNLNISEGLLRYIEEELQSAKIHHDAEWEYYSHPENEEKSNSLMYLFANKVMNNKERKRMKTVFRETYAGGRSMSTADVDFMAVCQGENFQTKEEKLELHCWYETETHSYWKVNPLKMEILHPNPRLVRIHEFVGSNFINHIQKLAAPHLERGGVTNLDTGKTDYTNFTTEPAEWMYRVTGIFKDRTQAYMKLMKRMEFLTGLHVETEAREGLQISSYAAGGHGEPHYDVLYGDRIATVMIYLNDVEKGGYTAFPRLGMAVRPIKGSAIFWYSLLRHGETDPKSLHAGCPVILGHKWVSNKWIENNENMFTRRCLLNYS